MLVLGAKLEIHVCFETMQKEENTRHIDLYSRLDDVQRIHRQPGGRAGKAAGQHHGQRPHVLWQTDHKRSI